MGFIWCYSFPGYDLFDIDRTQTKKGYRNLTQIYSTNYYVSRFCCKLSDLICLQQTFKLSLNISLWTRNAFIQITLAALYNNKQIYGH